jgi:hypothetical protein
LINLNIEIVPLILMNKVNEIIDLIKTKINNSKIYNYDEINKLSEEIFEIIIWAKFHQKRLGTGEMYLYRMSFIG